jgi:predicted deacetylase
VTVPRERDGRQLIAVAVHGIEPATFDRCALIRDWLDDHGVDRATLLAIPARDLHPVGERSPEMVSWLGARQRQGDSIAQHGFQHVRLGPLARGESLASLAHGRRVGEFTGLDSAEARRAVLAGWRVLKLAGIEPDGFVAPAYAYTSALRQALRSRFRWWAGLLRVHRSDPPAGVTSAGLSPAFRLAGKGRLSRVFVPPLVRLASLLPAQTLRVDVHPADLDDPRHMLALEWVLARNGGRRTAVTYSELAELAGRSSGVAALPVGSASPPSTAGPRGA